MDDSKSTSETHEALQEAFTHFLLAQKEILLAVSSMLKVFLEIAQSYEGTSVGTSIQSLCEALRSIIDLAVSRMPESGMDKDQARMEAYQTVQEVLHREMETLKKKEFLNLEEQSRLAALQSIEAIFAKEIEVLIERAKQKRSTTLREVTIEA